MTDDSRTFRHAAGFGKRIEFSIIAQLLKEGLDVYIPLVDDNGIDAVIRKSDGTFVEVQIKARSKKVKSGDEALFAAIRHDDRPNYWFIFHSEKEICDEEGKKCSPMTWVMSSREFLEESCENKSGKNKGLRSIWFNGKRGGKPYAKSRYHKYLAEPDYLSKRLLNENPDLTGTIDNTIA